LRPDVVWFGEVLDAVVLEDAFRRAAEADVCLVVGTSSLVYPAASVPLITLERGGAVVEVNPEETPLSCLARVTLRGKAASLLPALLD
jgi:NAD-dependent deacetylase